MKKPTTARYINFLGLTLIYIFFADRFDLHLLFSDTILTGGDSASWYQIALHLKEDLLPNWRLFGWNIDNYFGYNNLLHYFVFPFLLIVALGAFIPLSIALKVVSFIGILATPLAVYWTLKKLNYRDPMPLVGAWLSLYFLFHEHFSIFGGNLLSTLAGEFCFSIAFTLFIVFIGNFTYGVQKKTRLISNSILLTLIGLSHAFVFFSAILVPVFYLLTKTSFRKNLIYIASIYGIAFLLMAFWSLPMLADREFTSPIKMIWNFYDWQQFADELGWFTIIVSLISLPLLSLKQLRTPYILFNIYMMAGSIALYLIATSLQIPDIRFFPVWLFFSILLAIDLLAICLSKSTKPNWSNSLAISISILIGGSVLYSPDSKAPEWFSWNYSGYENKPAFQDGTLYDIRLLLKGDNNSGRVAFEHVDNNSEFGSDRFFENLPFFSNRATTEGIHYASGYLSKTITAMTGEYSLRSGGAESIIASHPDVTRLRDHFRLFNITQIIAKSSEIENMLRQSNDFNLLGYAGDYTIFEIKNYRPQYVETLPHLPPLTNIESNNAAIAIRHWFRRSGNISEVFVDKLDVAEINRNRYFSDNVATLSTTGSLLNKNFTKIEEGTVINEKIDHLKMQFETTGIGKPHIIKITYSPNWHSKNGEPIFRLSPGLMLIFPKTNNVELRFERSFIEYLGIILSLMGILLLVFLYIYRVKLTVSMQNTHIENHLIDKIEILRLPGIVFSLIAVIILSFQAYQEKQLIASDYETGNRLMNEKQYHEAIKYYQKLTIPELISDYDRDEIPHAFLAQAQAFLYLGEIEKSYQTLLTLKQHFPSWKLIDVVYEMLAQHEYKSGNDADASTYSKECQRLTSYTQFHRDCGASNTTKENQEL